ncbi:MAG: PSD1 domain-containing protein [Planctomycetes bacterium]|nr:PSD1 domain-containing protein [Planctomycetota bacterium]
MRWWNGLILAFLLPVVAAPVRAEERRVSFNRDVRPILSDTCYLCHGPDEGSRQAGLRLDLPEQAIRPTESGKVAIVAGMPGMSELVRRVMSQDPAEQMPPPKSLKTLTNEQRELLRLWIAQGARFDKHWSLEPLERPSITAGTHPIDALVQRKLASLGIKPSPRAARDTLLRRVTLDLTGLPPTPAERDRFLADNSPDAYANLVDRLLASEAYGERMTWDWLEAARYSDSNGYQGDGDRTMWPWRDWVVQSYNRNLSFRDFTIWQLAGDLLPSESFEQRLATGFLRNHPINGEGGRIAEENRIDYVMDMTETTGTVWLGMTVNCCRCHDHKFDSLTQRDYYSLFAFFNQTPVDGGGGNPQTPPILAVPTAAQKHRLEELDRERELLAKSVNTRRAELTKTRAAWEASELAKAAVDVWVSLAPATAQADHQTLKIQEDRTILASGENPPRDNYAISAPAVGEVITAIRLDSIRHPSMTNGGLARSDSGNFVLTDFEVHVRDAESKTMTRIPFKAAVATFEQGGFPASQAIDSDPNSGWAVWNGKSFDRDHAAVFRLATPLRPKPGDVLVFSLKHQSPHAAHNIGLFRLSVSSAPEPGLESSRQNLREALHVAAAARTPEQTKLVDTAFFSSDAMLAEQTASLQKIEASLEALRKELPKVMVMEDRPERRPTFVLEKGLYNKPLQEVTMALPASLVSAETRSKSTGPTAPTNRLALANWLVDDQNSLTPRVTVNRYWQMFFGIGLVKTAEDFGAQGEYPVHPELLDWLACELRDSGGDIKRLIRTIVTSETYCQSSHLTPEMAERDPDNRLLARGSRFRMPSWMIRDEILAASGILVTNVGGPPVRPYQPDGVWEEATFGGRRYTVDPGEGRYRRSLYTFWRRIVGPTMFFDTPSRSVCSVKPTRTNTPLQSLALLNDPTYVDAARHLAQQLREQKLTAEERIRRIYLRVLGREPTASEQTVLQSGVQRRQALYAADLNAARQIANVSADDTSVDPADQAAWISACLAVFNLDETVTRE